MSGDARWAVITGASSGIGEALAVELASCGFNVFLTGRNTQALERVAAECSSRFKVDTRVVTADLARHDSTDHLIRELSGEPRNYEILVNNAGFGIHGPFAATEIEQEVEMLNVQLAAALKLSKALLPGMISRRSGRILNVASVYSFAPVPLQSVYSACKAFLLSFSSSLRSELAGTGVTVTVFCPGITQTEFRSRAGISEKRKDSGMTAQEAARIARIHTLRGTHIVVPGVLNRVFVGLARILPRDSFMGLVKKINKQRGQ